MAYIFRGRLCAYFCDDCSELLSDVVVRLYRHREEQPITALAVANPKDTFALLKDDQVKSKTQYLLAETKTDANGNFTVVLNEEQYKGEAFEIDIYCGTIPHRPPRPKPHNPVQFSITTLQPQWKRGEEGYLAYWDYCISKRFWCAIMALFDEWVICGRVVTCEKKEAVAGVKVSAFDVDWIQDDSIGSTTTDAGGYFRIYYTSDAFKKTPFTGLDLELFGGPDLYFRVETGSGVVLLNEPSSRGRNSDRENVGNCFCVELCVDTNTPPPFNHPWFTHVGDFNIVSDFDSTTGKTNKAAPFMTSTAHGGPNYGFYDGRLGYGVKLKGFCPKKDLISGENMQYRFRFAPAATPLALTNITGDMITGVIVGSRPILWKLFDDTLVTTFQTIIIDGSGATVDPTPTPVGPGPWPAIPPHVIVPDADGWIKVDQNGLDDGFYGPLLRFVTANAVPGGTAPGNGASTLPAVQKSGAAIRLVFEAGPVTGGVTFTNDLPKILINNWSQVQELNLLQFHSGGGDPCSELSTVLDVEYTVDHELLGSWNLQILSESPSAPGTVIPPFPVGSTARGGAGTKHFDISTWQSCSYQVWLGSSRLLTDGEEDDSGGSLLKTFCKM